MVQMDVRALNEELENQSFFYMQGDANGMDECI
jgi:hypothetical protein